MSRQRSMETIARAEYVTIGELVRLTDVRYSTLKFYTEQGLLPFEQAEENLTRRYRRAQSVERIRLLRRLRAEGRTIAEVKAIVSAAGQQLSRGAENEKSRRRMPPACRNMPERRKGVLARKEQKGKGESRFDALQSEPHSCP